MPMPNLETFESDFSRIRINRNITTIDENVKSSLQFIMIFNFMGTMEPHRSDRPYFGHDRLMKQYGQQIW